MVPPYWLGVTPITTLEVVGLRHIGPEEKSRRVAFGQAQPAGKISLRHGFVVYSGGRETASGEQTG
jgi:hypothetical protein